MARHEVAPERLVHALDPGGTRGRFVALWNSLHEDGLEIATIRRMADELLDHLGALTTGADPALTGADARLVLRTAAECSFGVLDLGTYPEGDFTVDFPLIGRTLDSEELRFDDTADFAPTADTWVDVFAMCVISGLFWDGSYRCYIVLAESYAPSVRKGLPYSDLTSVSHPASLAAMDALCRYANVPDLPHLAPVPAGAPALRKPDAEERAAAAQALDAVGELSPDQHLLRALLTNDRQTFEQALTTRLVHHRDTTPADAPPRALLPVVPIALAALAVQVHGWELGITSGYLPAGLVQPRAVAA
ncbi:immunity 49 family protein [Kitasatospora sp. NPDC004669]|uniref:immunity 49 family protein n=1 Tax=Kitasatospora sp. NPDC004669 TaxID=3154555 RepID=UPI0033BCD267